MKNKIDYSKPYVKISTRLDHIETVKLEGREPFNEAHMYTKYELFNEKGECTLQFESGCLGLESEYNESWEGVEYKLFQDYDVKYIKYVEPLKKDA